MKRNTLYGCIFICLVMTSCEVEFDFRGLNDEPLLLVDGNVEFSPDYESVGHMNMYLYAVPSAAGNKEFSTDARCTLKVYVNSELVDKQDYITLNPFFGLVVGTYSAGPGDKISMTAEAEGFPAASASVVVPQLPPELAVSSEAIGKDMFKIRFSFEDDGSASDAYAFSFKYVSDSSKPDAGIRGLDLNLSFGNSWDTSALNVGPFDIAWKDGGVYYGVFDDTFNGEVKEFEVNASCELPKYQNRNYFRIEVFRISPERLRYEIACSDKASNVLGFIGLSPVTFAYTNVSGGSGCFSCTSISYTDWMVIPHGE